MSTGRVSGIWRVITSKAGLRIGNQSLGKLNLSSKARSLRRQLWIWPVVAALVLALVSWVITRRIDGTIKRHLEGHLRALVRSDVEAIGFWLGGLQDEVDQIAKKRQVVGSIQELLKLADESDLDQTQRILASAHFGRLRSTLDDLAMAPFNGYFVATKHGIIVCDSDPAMVGHPARDEEAQLITDVWSHGRRVAPPYPNPRMTKDASGRMQVGLPNMVVASLVLDGDDQPIAVLGMGLSPRGELAKLLLGSRFGESGETYAINRNGSLLTDSRFEGQLEEIGLLRKSASGGSALAIEVRDPGVDMTRGERPAKPREDQPFTECARSIMNQRSGSNVEGYRDYRGVPVIGAWEWAPQFQFGLVTEEDYDEAFQPLILIKRIVNGLICLLGLSAIAIFLFMYLLERKQRDLQSAVMAAKSLGAYTLAERIGSGGMGEVYRAQHAFLRRPTAIKLLNEQLFSEESVARFEREVQLTSQLTHPNTITIYDFGHTEEGVFYYVMELLEGLNLEQLVERYGPQPEARVIHIMKQVCSSLAEAHQSGLVHRDMKPANVFLTERGGIQDFVKVLDFGLARNVDPQQNVMMTQVGGLTGTPLYLAPEVIQTNNSFDARSDVYALGGIGYFLLTGTPVFQGASILDILTSHVRGERERPSNRLRREVSPSLESLLMECLERDPSDRPTDAAAMLKRLNSCDAMEVWGPEEMRTWWANIDLRPDGLDSSAPPNHTTKKAISVTMSIPAKE